MSLKIEATSQTSAQISLNDVVRLLINSDGTLEASESPDEGDESKRLATTEWVKNNSSDLARFHTYLWTGKAEAMPRGDQQSSGQQLSDLMYPTMRQDVMATQFYCTESDWQADPYKRVTHWSLGDGVSWMRTPDKNGVQPGNVGAFYGAGSNPAGGKTGTAVIDAMRNIKGSYKNPNWRDGSDGEYADGVFSVTHESGNSPTAQGNLGTTLLFDASKALPAGTTTDPITGEFRPRTWYGIWMIRMYGRVTNIAALDAAGFNARLDMLDARMSGLEATANGRTYVMEQKVSVRTMATWFTNDSDTSLDVWVSGKVVVAGGTAEIEIEIADGSILSIIGSSYPVAGMNAAVACKIPPRKRYRVPAGVFSSLQSWGEGKIQ